MAIYEKEKIRIASVSDAGLDDIIHDAEELIWSRTFTERTGAEIIRTAAQITKEERKKDNKP